MWSLAKCVSKFRVWAIWLGQTLSFTYMIKENINTKNSLIRWFQLHGRCSEKRKDSGTNNDLIRKDKVLFLQALYRHQAPPWLKPFVSSKCLYVNVQIIMALPGHPQTYLPIYHIFIILCLVIYLYNHSIAAGQAFRIQSCCCHCGCCKCEDICFGLNIFYVIYMKRDWAEHRCYVEALFHRDICFHLFTVRVPFQSMLSL